MRLRPPQNTVVEPTIKTIKEIKEERKISQQMSTLTVTVTMKSILSGEKHQKVWLSRRLQPTIGPVS